MLTFELSVSSPFRMCRSDRNVLTACLLMSLSARRTVLG